MLKNAKIRNAQQIARGAFRGVFAEGRSGVNLIVLDRVEEIYFENWFVYFHSRLVRHKEDLIRAHAYYETCFTKPAVFWPKPPPMFLIAIVSP